MKRAALLVAALIVLGGCTDKGSKPGESSGKAGGESGCSEAAVAGGVNSLPAPPGEEPEYGDMLVRRLDAEPATLNPLTATDAYEQRINSFVMESLLGTDLATGEPEPALAESWEVGDDKVTFTFHMRKNATFHDGTPVTADDVIYSMDRIMDTRVDAPVLRSYYVDCESYEKLDDYTVRVKWKKPYFLALEWAGGAPVMPRHVLDDGTDFNKHPFGRHPVGSGPYKFAEWQTGQKILLERYDGYWGEKPYVDRIYWKIITGDEVALRVMKKGELDFIPRLSPTQWMMQTSSREFLDRFNKLYYDYPTYNYIGWNQRNPLFQDKRVRQSLTMLLNREAVRREIYHCLATIATGPFFPKNGYFDPGIEPWPYDPARAKAQLIEAGWMDTDGDGIIDKDGVPFRFELSFTAGVPEWERLAIIYKEDLKKAGIDMQIRTLEWAVFAENVAQWKFDACAMSWALTSKPDSYQIWHSSQADIPGSSNHVGFKNEEVDRLIELNRAEFDKDKRIEYCRQIHRIMHEEQPYTFNMVRMELSVVDKRFHDVVPYPVRPIFKFDKWYVPKGMQKYQ